MVEQVGKYLVEIENNSIGVYPLRGAQVRDVQHATFYEAQTLRPAYVSAYCKMKVRYVGLIYLIHFDRPYKHACHYLGFTKNLDRRLLRHSAGHGARLMQVVEEAGIGWNVVRVWYGDRYLERRLKGHHGSMKLCPICKAGRMSKVA